MSAGTKSEPADRIREMLQLARAWTKIKGKPCAAKLRADGTCNFNQPIGTLTTRYSNEISIAHLRACKSARIGSEKSSEAVTCGISRGLKPALGSALVEAHSDTQGAADELKQHPRKATVRPALQLQDARADQGTLGSDRPASIRAATATLILREYDERASQLARALDPVNSTIIVVDGAAKYAVVAGLVAQRNSLPKGNDEWNGFPRGVAEL